MFKDHVPSHPPGRSGSCIQQVESCALVAQKNECGIVMYWHGYWYTSNNIHHLRTHNNPIYMLRLPKPPSKQNHSFKSVENKFCLLPPMVLSWNSWNWPLTKRSTKLDLPTADSPSSTSLNWQILFAAAAPLGLVDPPPRPAIDRDRGCYGWDGLKQIGERGAKTKAESGDTGTDGERGQMPNYRWEEPDRVGSGGVTRSTLKNKIQNMENQWIYLQYLHKTKWSVFQVADENTLSIKCLAFLVFNLLGLQLSYFHILLIC